MLLKLLSATSRNIDNNLVIHDLLADSNLPFDFVIADLNGKHPRVVNHISHRVYFVLSGSGKVTVGSDIYTVQKDDLVSIPRGTIHSIEGHLRYIIVTAPPFDPNNEVIVD